MSPQRSIVSPIPVQALLLVLLMLLIAWAGGGRSLLQRQMWMDEIHSWLLIQEPETQRALQALADGVDYNPPTYILLARQLHYLPSGITELRLRMLSLALMFLAIVAVFILLRRRFPSLICVAAVLFMASSVHLIHQSAEMRFYPLWVAACAWLCVALDVSGIEKPWHRRSCNVAALVLAAIITTTHYFGILTLGLICLGAILVPELTRGRRLIVLIVAITGGLCLFGCLPFLIVQRAALSQATWVSPATVADSVGFLTAVIPVIPVIVCGLAFLISLPRSGSAEPKLAPLAASVRHLAPCLFLALMPLLIILLSWTIQPALVVRYAVTGVLGFGPLFAILLSRCSHRLQIVVVVVSSAIFLHSVAICSNQWSEVDDARKSLAVQLQQLPDDGPIVFEDRTVSMPLLHSHPQLRSRCFLIDFADDQLTGESRLRSVQRDVGRRIERWYPEYAMRSLNSLEDESAYFVVPYMESASVVLHWPSEYKKTSISPRVDRYDRNSSQDRKQ